MSYFTCYNLDELQTHVKWKRPETKDCILYNSIYMKCPEKVNLQSQEVDEKLLGAEDGGWETGINVNGDDGNVKVFYGDGHTTR